MTGLRYKIRYAQDVSEARAYESAAGFLGGNVRDRRAGAADGHVCVWLTIDASDEDAMDQGLENDDLVVSYTCVAL